MALADSAGLPVAHPDAAVLTSGVVSPLSARHLLSTGEVGLGLGLKVPSL